MTVADLCRILSVQLRMFNGIKAAARVPSPLGGERVRVRGARRTRSDSARDFARRLRRKSTDSEKRLWRLLRGRHFEGYKFRRQYPCGAYFLDFVCVEAKLSVELDGGGHGFPSQRDQDQERDKFLSAQGIKILRFWNHQLHGELEAVRFEIWHALMERTGRTDVLRHLKARPPEPPHLNPLPQGGEETRLTTYDNL